MSSRLVTTALHSQHEIVVEGHIHAQATIEWRKEMTQDKWLDWAVSTSHRSNRFLAMGKMFMILNVLKNAANCGRNVSGAFRATFEVVKELFCNESGYQTPKLDTRAPFFRDNKILLFRKMMILVFAWRLV